MLNVLVFYAAMIEIAFECFVGTIKLNKLNEGSSFILANGKLGDYQVVMLIPSSQAKQLTIIKENPME